MTQIPFGKDKQISLPNQIGLTLRICIDVGFLLREDHGFVGVGEDAVGEVPADGA